MILVIGATGMVGTEVCRLLISGGRPVRALVRPASEPSKVENLQRLGASVVKGDLRDAVSLKAACQGVSAIIGTASSMPFAYAPGDNTPQTTDRDGYLRVIEAAREAQVRQFIYISFPPMGPAFPLHDAKRAVEKYLRESGLVFTILQPTFFSEVWLSPGVGFDYAHQKATLYGAGENPISWISFRNVAQFAVYSLDNPAARNATLQLGGPRGISPCGVVKVFEKACGKPFAVTNVPVEALQKQYDGATDPMQKSFSGLMIGYANGLAIDMGAALKAFPVKLGTVEEYARRATA